MPDIPEGTPGIAERAENLAKWLDFNMGPQVGNQVRGIVAHYEAELAAARTVGPVPGTVPDWAVGLPDGETLGDWAEPRRLCNQPQGVILGPDVLCTQDHRHWGDHSGVTASGEPVTWPRALVRASA